MLVWIFFSSYCVNNRLQKGFVCFVQLCLSAPDCCAPIGKRHAGHTRMANKILWAAKCSCAREVFTSSWLCQGSMGREQKSGESKARKGAEVLQKEAGRASARHGASEAQPSCPPLRGWTAAEVPQKPVCLPARRSQSTALQTNFSLEPLFFLFDVFFFPSGDTSSASQLENTEEVLRRQFQGIWSIC